MSRELQPLNRWGCLSLMVLGVALMPWTPFLLFAGGLLWAIAYGIHRQFRYQRIPLARRQAIEARQWAKHERECADYEAMVQSDLRRRRLLDTPANRIIVRRRL